MATLFPPQDAAETRASAAGEMCKPALRYLLGQTAAALYLATRAAILRAIPPRPRTVIREYRDRPGYWQEQVHSHQEVSDHLQKTWAASIHRQCQPKSLGITGDTGTR